MIKSAVWVVLSLMAFWGCSSHTPDPNERMMNNVMGELDRESAK